MRVMYSALGMRFKSVTGPGMLSWLSFFPSLVGEASRNDSLLVGSEVDVKLVVVTDAVEQKEVCGSTGASTLHSGILDTICEESTSSSTATECSRNPRWSSSNASSAFSLLKERNCVASTSGSAIGSRRRSRPTYSIDLHWANGAVGVGVGVAFSIAIVNRSSKNRLSGALKSEIRWTSSQLRESASGAPVRNMQRVGAAISKVAKSLHCHPRLSMRKLPVSWSFGVEILVTAPRVDQVLKATNSLPLRIFVQENDYPE